MWNVLIPLIAVYALWVFFLAVMSLQRAKAAGLLTRTALVLAYPVIVAGLLIDFVVNALVMTVLFLDLPRELTVTARLKRHNRHGSGWRQRLAKWFEPLLDPFDPDLDHI